MPMTTLGAIQIMISFFCLLLMALSSFYLKATVRERSEYEGEDHAYL